MFNFDKSSMTIVGIIVCLLACLYLYKENQKHKSEFSAFAAKVANQLSRGGAPVNEEKKPVVMTPPVKKPTIVKKKEEEVDSDSESDESE
jgi:hypothetical protein